MPVAKSVRAIAGAAIILVFVIQPASAQTSIGFENPDDNTNILEYRLPDWGYRTWDLGFGLNGSGGDRYQNDENQNAYNRFRTALDSGFRLYRESEVRTYRLVVNVGGDYEKTHSSSHSNVNSAHQLDGILALGGGWTQYVSDGPFSLRLTANTNQRYSEVIQEISDGQETVENSTYRRANSYFGNVGVGWGRVRDVTPLIRAQRLSERLSALGRDRLTAGQVQEIARVLATEQGYRMVFDRPDKSFWADVLSPMLGADNPLSPYEIFYLRDILEEDVGPRGEGFEIVAGAGYNDSKTSGSDSELRAITRGPALDLRWVRNLSMNHQLALGAGVNYFNQSRQGTRVDLATGDIAIDYLWTIADRYRWDTHLGLTGSYQETGEDGEQVIERNLETLLESQFKVFIENNMSLALSVNGRNTQEYLDIDFQGYDERYRRAWQWSYGIGLQYYLDRVLY